MDSTSSWSSSSHWGTFWGQFQIELIGGIIGSFIFLFVVLFLFKPKIKIATFLTDMVNNAGQTIYVFKFVNRSFFSAHEIKIELHKMRRIPMGSGNVNYEYYPLTLLSNSISHIPARPPFWKKNLAYPHCITVRSTENLNDILADPYTGIMLRVSLKHGLTGLSKVFEQEYGNQEDIKTGKFKPGTKFEII